MRGGDAPSSWTIRGDVFSTRMENKVACVRFTAAEIVEKIITFPYYEIPTAGMKRRTRAQAQATGYYSRTERRRILGVSHR